MTQSQFDGIIDASDTALPARSLSDSQAGSLNQGQQGQQPQQGQQGPQGQQPARPSLAELLSGAAPRVSAVTGGMLTKLQAMWPASKTNLTTGLPAGYTFEMLPLQGDLYFASVLMALGFGGRVYFQPIIIESSNVPPPPIDYATERRADTNAPISLPRSVADTIDATYDQECRKLIATRFPGKAIIPIDATFIPRTMSETDTAALDRVLYDSLTALVTTQSTLTPNWPDINLTKARAGGRMMATLSMSRGIPFVDGVGLPRRSDFSISVRQGQVLGAEQARASLHGATGDVLVDIGGYIDLIYSLKDAPPASERFRCLLPRIILTNMKTMGPPTPGSFMLAIREAVRLRRMENWGGVLRERQAKSAGRDPADLGAINILAKTNPETDNSVFGSPVDVKASSISPEAIGRWLDLTCHPTPLVTSKFSLVGPDAWSNNIVLMAASGNPDANNMLINAANTLTGGALKNLMKEKGFVGGMFLAGMPVESQLEGYFPSNNGSGIPIDQVDLLAVLNTFPQDGPVISKWVQAGNGSMSEIKRNDARLEIATQVMGNVTPVITGRSALVNWNGAFLDLLETAIAASAPVELVNPFALVVGAGLTSASWAMAGSLGSGNQGGATFFGSALSNQPGGSRYGT